MPINDEGISNTGQQRDPKSGSVNVERSSSKIHIHLAAMAPQFMDVRTSLPLRNLAGCPGVKTSYSHQNMTLPQLAAEEAKVVIIQRVGVPDLERYKTVIRATVEKGWIVIVEFDDHPDLVNAVHGRPPSEAMWHAIRLAHGVQTSTLKLADVFREYNPEVAVFPNAAFRLGVAQLPAKRGTGLRVFYGALNRERFSARVGTALSAFAERRSDIEFIVIHDRAFFDGLGAANKALHSAMPYERYLAVMESCDVALMPLEGTSGELYKSDVKYVEASSLGLTSLASPPVYGGTIIDGVNGFIVPNIDDWPRFLGAVSDDPNLRQRVSAKAHAYVAGQRTFEAQIPQRLAWYADLWERRHALTRTLSERFRES